MNQWLALLGIRADEKKAVALLFTNMFMSGIAIGMIRVCAFTLFLEKFGSEQLALVAVLTFTGLLVTLAIDRATHNYSPAVNLYTILGTVVVGLLGFRLLLGVSDSKIIIFTLPLFFEIVYMLFSMQFTVLLSRLLHIRQSKRLAGLTRSGEYLAEIVGGLSIALLLNYMKVLDLLVVATLSTLIVAVIVRYTVSSFQQRLARSNVELADEGARGHFLGLLKLPYVRLISLCYAAYIFAYYFLDVAFYDYASTQFPEQRRMAEFIGEFSAATGLVTLFAMVFLFAPFLRRFGILAGVIAFPIVIAIGAASVTTFEVTGATAATIFAVMVVTNASRYILFASIWRPSAQILFQVLPDRQRSQGSSLIDGFVDPVGGSIVGVILYLLTNYLGWEPKTFLILLSVIMVLWITMGIAIRRMYLSNLVVSIQKRKLGQMSLKELDGASIDLIKQGLNSEYPAEIYYCLDILEELEHPEITELIKQVMTKNNNEVRMHVLTRIARMEIKPLASHVNARIEQESDPAVRGQALRTYAALAAPDTVEKMTPYLDAFHTEIRKGALVGLLTYDAHSSLGQDVLLTLVRSADVEDRVFAAQVMGEIASGAFSGFLVELLDDFDPGVVNEAVVAAGHMADPRLVNILVARIADPRYIGRASASLQQIGEVALSDLDLGLTSPNATRQEKRQIIDIIREIGGPHAIEILLRHIDMTVPELRHQIYLSLANLHYQADPDDQYVFVNRLEEEVQQITWLLASMDDLSTNDKYRTLITALGQEVDQHRDNMLLLLTFLFPSIVMLDTRANLESKVSDLRVFALEVLDNLLTTEIKQVVIPILDDISVHERLDKLNARYPQPAMAADARLYSLIEEHFDELFFWTRANLLHHIGIEKADAHLSVVHASLKSVEPIVRETASWALAQLNPPDLRRVLTAHADDQSPAVSRVVRHLLASL